MKKQIIKLSYIIGFLCLLLSIAWAHTGLAIVSGFIIAIMGQLIMLVYILVSTKMRKVRLHALAIYCTTLVISWVWFLTGSGVLYAAIGVLLIPPLVSFVFTVVLVHKYWLR